MLASYTDTQALIVKENSCELPKNHSYTHEEVYRTNPDEGA